MDVSFLIVFANKRYEYSGIVFRDILNCVANIFVGLVTYHYTMVGDRGSFWDTAK